MRSLFIILFMALFHFYANAQTSVAYQYDASGNRTWGALYVQRMLPDSVEDDVRRSLEWQVSIYPNPTKGHLVVKILNFTDGHNGTLAIYTTSGQEVLSSRISSESTELDLSSYSNGVYIMRIRIDGEDKSWKIIKEA